MKRFDSLTHMKTARVAAVLLITLSLSACASDAASPVQKNLPVQLLSVAGIEVNVEIADTPQRRQIGLMNRKALAPMAGMLFIFDEAQTQCMWMKNTLIDLDVAFLDTQGRIINVETMKAGTTDVHCSKAPAIQALEMNARWFESHQVKPGQTVGRAGKTSIH